MTEKEVGQVGYEAYSAHTGGKSLATGGDLPAWGDLPKSIQEAWNVAADAILDNSSEAFNEDVNELDDPSREAL